MPFHRSALTALVALSFPLTLIAAAAESIQEVPIAISAFTGETMREHIENMDTDTTLRFFMRPGEGGLNTVSFSSQYKDSGGAFPDIDDIQRIEVLRDPTIPGATTIVLVGPEGAGGARLITTRGNSQFKFTNVVVRGFNTPDDGGVVRAVDNSEVHAFRARFELNRAGKLGGVVAAFDNARIRFSESVLDGNSAGEYGGGLSLDGSATAHVQRTVFRDGSADIFGCHINATSNGIYRYGSAVVLDGVQLGGHCPESNYEGPFGNAFMHASSLANTQNGIDSTGNFRTYGSVYDNAALVYKQQSSGNSDSSTKALCNDFGSGAFESLGYNISSDNSCALDQMTDLPGTDPQFEVSDDGLLVPADGSPLIDSGATDVSVFPGETLASLPCGYKDLAGIGRPQDASGDGIFECDRGAVERAGLGQIVTGHSGAFFNALRDGEGTYVEILNETTVLVYTFTYRPDGSGPAWFIGVGSIVGNSIVIDDLLRPSGTSFGDGFNTADILLAPAGGMSMVFPDCEAASPGGNVAYSGNKDIGYEALMTRATRLSNITGCGAITPHPNAGLSGSYFDLARDGEGIIVEWLPNGDVLVVFFTYDQNDNQLWLLGIGKAEGNTVTMDALYASSYTKWGSEYDAAEKVIDTWGTFMLTWTECGGVEFKYDSTVEGYGSATHNYARLSFLAGTSCPAF